MLEICKMLTLSMEHISEKSIQLLENEPKNNILWLTVYPKDEFGFWIHVPDYFDEEEHDLPEDIFRCMELAHRNGCTWLCLDVDGEVAEELEVFHFH